MSIIEDALQLAIIGGSLQQLPWKDDVILDASKSKDPNEVDQNQLQFEWYCEIITGDILLNDCFGNGENIVEYFGPKWKIGKKILLEGVTYQFKVVVSNSKKNRQGSKKQTVLLVDAEIPVVVIRYLIYFGKFEEKEFVVNIEILKTFIFVLGCTALSAVLHKILRKTLKFKKNRICYKTFAFLTNFYLYSFGVGGKTLLFWNED